MANPRDLTITTALETCGDNYPHDEFCGICQMLLSDSAELESGQSSDDEVVRPYACENHYFHRGCLMAWLNSNTPPLNLCPLDRRVLFGTAPVRQRVNMDVVFTFAEFPGHDTDLHDPFFTGDAELLQERARAGEHARTRGSPASIGLPPPIVRTPVEQVLFDSCTAAAALTRDFATEFESRRQTRLEEEFTTNQLRIQESQDRQRRAREARLASEEQIELLEAEVLRRNEARGTRQLAIQDQLNGFMTNVIRPSRQNATSPDPSLRHDNTPSSSPEDPPARTNEEVMMDREYLVDLFVSDPELAGWRTREEVDSDPVAGWPTREDEEPDDVISPEALAQFRPRTQTSAPSSRVLIADSEEHEVPEEDVVPRAMPDENIDEYDDADRMHWMSI